MIKIEYPPYNPQTKTINGNLYIFDTIRKQWLYLTPEEWVRQNFLRYLITVKNYPASLIAIEKEIRLGDLAKRFDIVVYDRNTKPWMIIECKEMNAVLSQAVLNQVLRYNISMSVPHIVITNGSHCYGFSTVKGQLQELNALPEFDVS